MFSSEPPWPSPLLDCLRSSLPASGAPTGPRPPTISARSSSGWSFWPCAKGPPSCWPPSASSLKPSDRWAPSSLIWGWRAGEDRLEIGAEHHRARMRPGDDAVALDRPACSKAADLLDAIGGHGGSLAAAMARGVKLGSPTGAETIGKARAARTEQAAKANATTRAVTAELQRTRAGPRK